MFLNIRKPYLQQKKINEYGINRAHLRFNNNSYKFIY